MREQGKRLSRNLLQSKILGHDEDDIDIPRVGTCGNETTEHKQAFQSPGACGKFVEMPQLRKSVHAGDRVGTETPFYFSPVGSMYARREVAFIGNSSIRGEARNS